MESIHLTRNEYKTDPDLLDWVEFLGTEVQATFRIHHKVYVALGQPINLEVRVLDAQEEVTEEPSKNAPS